MRTKKVAVKGIRLKFKETKMKMIALYVTLFIFVSIEAYNEEKPIYKWSPIVFRNLKKDDYQYRCAPEKALCMFSWSKYGMYMKQPCCHGLVCERIGIYNMCLRPVWEQNEVNSLY
ncbi:uncharacterized protein LOC111637977 isoform X1 [Centruroides sculpturatus]|uniref:uncharacterized protein LOC111637977 isoform X1 n=2 Tax=Centruroides sculpturatus TaxID=218467 RepID=UPI000C6E19B8|nr:uncharacterized protein LOC111637977 isoform X1 [Centruroides sculpturatus]